MVLVRMKKLLKREAKDTELLHRNLFKKVYLHKVLNEFRLRVTKFEKTESLMRKNTLNLVFKGLREFGEHEKTLYSTYFYERMAYKVLYILKRY